MGRHEEFQVASVRAPVLHRTILPWLGRYAQLRIAKQDGVRTDVKKSSTGGYYQHVMDDGRHQAGPLFAIGSRQGSNTTTPVTGRFQPRATPQFPSISFNLLQLAKLNFSRMTTGRNQQTRFGHIGAMQGDLHFLHLSPASMPA